MGFKNMKRDDHGHVIGNDETDGQKCQHQSGSGKSSPEQKLMKNKNIRDAVVEDTLKDTNVNQNAIKTLMDEAFDDDYEEEFNEGNDSEYLDKTWNDYFSKQKGWERQENGRYDFGDDMNYGSVNNDGDEPGKLTAIRVRNGDHEHPEKEYFEDPQEAREWVEDDFDTHYYDDDGIEWLEGESPEEYQKELQKTKGSKPSIDYDEINKRKNETPEESYERYKRELKEQLDETNRQNMEKMQKDKAGKRTRERFDELNRLDAEYSKQITSLLNQGKISEANELRKKSKEINDELNTYGSPVAPQFDDAGYQLKDKEYGVEKKEPFKPKYDPEDFEDARFYPTESRMDGHRWVGRYRGIGEALGLKDWNDERVKHVGDHNGTSMYQLPDGYYSINPNITSMSFKTKEALQDYLDEKNPEEHKYGVYWDGDIQRTYRGKGDDGKEYDMEGPDAYKAARKPKEQKTDKLNYSPEMKKVKNAIKGLTLDSKEERRKLLLQMLDEIDNEE